ncbi:MarR family winged helix-turn-helix transcriptional regulator [Bacillus gaemokensis]|uniref:MarR family transcriptional regulator n=1 Tax=Bacillus gaemokensis TaxID=574375 RepID=A0A073KDT0_9BACI|nr:MarR family winged helix-turn-helix transcriptional regulator [Bacillus gaemokensis]KEK24750.1 MarR family transcriptional regulator [Bacillus gaemokensis]KYG34573.1 MarR family transcriptional regulator [Bacillus gaemokensis]
MPNNNLQTATKVMQSFLAIQKTTATFTQQNAVSLGLTVSQIGILNTIYAKPDLTLKAVTKLLSLPKSTVSVSIEGLLQLGFIEREQSQEDRREIKLNITSKGKEVVQKSIKNSSSYRAMATALEKMPEEDTQTLLRIHSQLLSYLQEVDCK